MSGLNFRQRLTGYDGRATRQAKLALGALVAVAFAVGFLLHPGGAEPAPKVASSSLDGEVAGATGTPEAQTLALRAAASLPALRRPAKRPSRKRSKPKRNPAPAVTPVVTPAPTPEDTTTSIVEAPEPAAAAPAPTAAPPAPTAAPPSNTPSGDIFDSSG